MSAVRGHDNDLWRQERHEAAKESVVAVEDKDESMFQLYIYK